MYRFHVTVLIIFLVCVAWPGVVPAGDEGLAGRWPFDEISRDGRHTPDVSGNGRDGRIFGQRLVEGVLGKALLFEGFDHRVEIGDLRLKAPATVAFWVRTNDMFHDRRLFSQTEGGKNQAGALRFDGTRIEVWDGTGWKTLIDRNVRLNTWMHVAVVFGEDGRTVGFLNGGRQHLVKCGFDFDGVGAAIGWKFLGTVGNEFTGRMDDFRIYRRALSGDEIRRLYESGR